MGDRREEIKSSGPKQNGSFVKLGSSQKKPGVKCIRRLYGAQHKQLCRSCVRPVSGHDLCCSGSKNRGCLCERRLRDGVTTNIFLRREYRFTEFGSGQVALPTIDGIDLNSFACTALRRGREALARYDRKR
jgi:hypothetical protein